MARFYLDVTKYFRHANLGLKLFSGVGSGIGIRSVNSPGNASNLSTTRSSFYLQQSYKHYWCSRSWWCYFDNRTHQDQSCPSNTMQLLVNLTGQHLKVRLTFTWHVLLHTTGQRWTIENIHFTTLRLITDYQYYFWPWGFTDLACRFDGQNWLLYYLDNNNQLKVKNYKSTIN